MIKTCAWGLCHHKEKDKITAYGCWMWFYSPLAEHTAIWSGDTSILEFTNVYLQFITIDFIWLSRLMLWWPLSKGSYSIILGTAHGNSLKQVRWKNWPQSEPLNEIYMLSFAAVKYLMWCHIRYYKCYSFTLCAVKHWS